MGVPGLPRGGKQGADPECSRKLHQFRAGFGRTAIMAGGSRRFTRYAGWTGFFAAGGGPRLSVPGGGRGQPRFCAAEQWRGGIFLRDESPDCLPADIGEGKRVCRYFRWAADLSENGKLGCRRVVYVGRQRAAQQDSMSRMPANARAGLTRQHAGVTFTSIFAYFWAR